MATLPWPPGLRTVIARQQGPHTGLVPGQHLHVWFEPQTAVMGARLTLPWLIRGRPCGALTHQGERFSNFERIADVVFVPRARTRQSWPLQFIRFHAHR